MTRDDGAAPTREDGRRTTDHDKAATTTVNADPSQRTHPQPTDADGPAVCPTCGHDPTDLDAATAALRAAKNQIIRRQATIDAYLQAFEDVWTAPVPKTWRRTLKAFQNAGLPRSVMLECVDIALDADHVSRDKRFAYFSGVAWNRIRDMDEYALNKLMAET